MTEKKRFVKYDGYSRFSCIDTEQEKYLYLDEVIYLLNKLNDENRQLRRQVAECVS